MTDGQPTTFILTGNRGSIEGTGIRHPLFSKAHWFGYDFAIIRFPHSIFDDTNVDSTGLVPFAVSDNTIAPGVPLDWYGMGNYGNDCSQFTPMTVTRYQGVAFTSLQDDWQYVLSSTQKSICSGDSGGPVLSVARSWVSTPGMAATRAT